MSLSEQPRGRLYFRAVTVWVMMVLIFLVQGRLWALGTTFLDVDLAQPLLTSNVCGRLCTNTGSFLFYLCESQYVPCTPYDLRQRSSYLRDFRSRKAGFERIFSLRSWGGQSEITP